MNVLTKEEIDKHKLYHLCHRSKTPYCLVCDLFDTLDARDKRIKELEGGFGICTKCGYIMLNSKALGGGE